MQARPSATTRPRPRTPWAAEDVDCCTVMELRQGHGTPLLEGAGPLAPLGGSHGRVLGCSAAPALARLLASGRLRRPRVSPTWPAPAQQVGRHVFSRRSVYQSPLLLSSPGKHVPRRDQQARSAADRPARPGGPAAEGGAGHIFVLPRGPPACGWRHGRSGCGGRAEDDDLSCGDIASAVSTAPTARCHATPVLSEYSIAQIRDDDGTRRGLRRHGLRAGRRRGGDSRWPRWAS